MDFDRWSDDFNPREILSRIDLIEFIDRNRKDNASHLAPNERVCILCNKGNQEGIILSDRSFLCESCLFAISETSYPEKYERAWKQYLKDREVWQNAKDEFFKNNEYEKGSNLPRWLALASVLWWGKIGSEAVAVTVILFLVSLLIAQRQERKLLEWNEKKFEWEEAHPEPVKPEVRHFHDPRAKLTARDEVQNS